MIDWAARNFAGRPESLKSRTLSDLTTLLMGKTLKAFVHEEPRFATMGFLVGFLHKSKFNLRLEIYNSQ